MSSVCTKPKRWLEGVSSSSAADSVGLDAALYQASSLYSYWFWARMGHLVSLRMQLLRPGSGTLPRWDNAPMIDFLNGFSAHLIYLLLFFLLLLCGIGFPMAEELVLLAGGVLVASGCSIPS